MRTFILLICAALGGCGGPDNTILRSYDDPHAGKVFYDPECRGWYWDDDGDGYPRKAVQYGINNPGKPCSMSASWHPVRVDRTEGVFFDCNDADREVYPGAVEVLDYRDNDCDELVDEGFVQLPCYPDADGDGAGDLNARPTVWVIDGQKCPGGYSEVNSDFDDDNPDLVTP